MGKSPTSTVTSGRCSRAYWLGPLAEPHLARQRRFSFSQPRTVSFLRSTTALSFAPLPLFTTSRVPSFARSTSLPLPPASVSVPLEPTSRSRPEPPPSVSLPLPPSSTSLPLPPIRQSAPASPFRMSLPPSPKSRSPKAVPVIVCALPLPRTTFAHRPALGTTGSRPHDGSSVNRPLV